MMTLHCILLPEEPAELYKLLYPLAEPERKKRADRYLRQEDGLRCLAAGELLRRTAEKVLGLTEFQVITEPGGKSRIAVQEHFHYNLSHSGLRVAIAWGSNPVGVDVQQMLPDVNTEELAKRFFTADEQVYIFEQPEQTALRFYQVWTGKESYLKYLGTGLKKSLTSFSVLDPEIARLLQFRYLPDGYCVSICSNDPNCVFELEDQPFQ